MTVHQRFTLSDREASAEAKQEALSALNAVKLQEDHIRHGFGFLIAADFEMSGAAAGRLLAFVRAEGLYPADVAAQAIAIRAGWLRDFIEGGGDPERGWAYASFASREITAADLGYLKGPEDQEDPLEDDSIPW